MNFSSLEELTKQIETACHIDGTYMIYKGTTLSYSHQIGQEVFYFAVPLSYNWNKCEFDEKSKFVIKEIWLPKNCKGFKKYEPTRDNLIEDITYNLVTFTRQELEEIKTIWEERRPLKGLPFKGKFDRDTIVKLPSGEIRGFQRVYRKLYGKWVDDDLNEIKE